MNPSPLILIVEDDPVTGLIFERMILTHLPECRPIWVRTLAEARERSADLAVALFVLDVNLPDGSGLDFLFELSHSHPDSQAVVMSATPLPEYEAQSAAFGALRFLAKPLSAADVKRALEEVLTSRRVGEDEAYRVSLKNLTFFDVVQLKCLARATASLQFSSDGRVGTIHFLEGEIIDAQTGGVGGFEALQEIARWRRGSINESPLMNMGLRSIDSGWQSLVIDLAHRLDDARQV